MSAAAQVFRLALGAGGLVVILAGAVSLVGVPLPALVSIVIFLALVVIVNDGVIAPLTLAGAALSRRLLPRGYLAPLLVATMMLGTLSVVALPVLVGINESPDNTTVVDRPYRLTWLVLLAVAVVAVAVAGAVRSARSRPEPSTVAAAPSAGPVREGAGHGAGRTVLAVALTAVTAVGAVRAPGSAGTPRPPAPRPPRRRSRPRR